MHARICRVLVAAAAAALAASTFASAGAVERSADRPSVVFVLYSVGCSDPYDSLLCGAFRRSIQSEGVTGRIISITDREDPVATLELVAREGHDLVVAFGFSIIEPLGTAARRQPRQLFAVFDRSRADVPGTPRNVRGVLSRSSEAAYLAGWLAARLERTRPGADAVGVVGGVKLPSVEEFVVGFRAGARRAVPAIRVMVGYSDDFVDMSKCEAIARRQIAAGAGAVFNVAGGCGLGALEAAGDRGVWGIGVDTDQSFLGPHVLTSVVKNFDAAFVKLLRELKRGALGKPHDVILTLADGGVGLSKVSPKVPAGIRAELEDLRRRIAVGGIRVPGTVPRPG